MRPVADLFGIINCHAIGFQETLHKCRKLKDTYFEAELRISLLTQFYAYCTSSQFSFFIFQVLKSGSSPKIYWWDEVIPYIIVNTRIHDCQNGVDRCKAKKEKNKLMVRLQVNFSL